MRARCGRSAEIAGVTAEEADHSNGYCAIPGFGWGIFWKEGVCWRLASGSCRARVVHGAAGRGAAERSRGAGVTAGKKELPGGVSLSAREATCMRTEQGDGERVCAVTGRMGEKGSSWAALGHAGGKGGGTAWAVRSLGWAGLG